MTSEKADEAQELFALYGFALTMPKGWRVEFNPKGTREKGDVVFHSPERNKVYISWGPLEEATRRFKTVEEQRDWGLENLRRTRSVKSISVAETKEIVVCGHKALVTRIVASVGGGLLSAKQPDSRSDSMYLHCPEESRFYILYSALKSPSEYPDFSRIFDLFVQSLVCHGAASV